MNIWKKVGVCGVDAGMIHIGDPCYLKDKDENQYLDRKGLDRAWEGLTDAKQLNYKAGHAGFGVLISGFGGDGTYPVYIKKNKQGMVTAAKIVFDEAIFDKEE